MNRAGIADRVARGFGIAARVLGEEFDHYRPSPTAAAFSAATWRGKVRAAIDDNLSFAAKERYGEAVRMAAMDGRAAEVGDYLRGDGGTFFVASLPDIGTPHVVQCNATLTVRRPTPGATGDAHYGGDVRAAAVALLAAWPGAMVQAGTGGPMDAGLPGDPRGAWWTIYLPASASAQLRASDVVEDDQATPMRWIIASAERTDMGWRLRAQQAVA